MSCPLWQNNKVDLKKVNKPPGYKKKMSCNLWQNNKV